MRIRIINPIKKTRSNKRILNNSKVTIKKSPFNKDYFIVSGGLKRHKPVSTLSKTEAEEIKQARQSLLNKLNLNKEKNKMTKRKASSRRRRNSSVPVFLNKRRKSSYRRRNNPASVGAFSVEGVADTLMQGVTAAAGAVGVQFLVGKFFNFENVWVKYLALAGLGMGAGYIAGTFNKNMGKNIAIGTITLVAAQIINDQILNKNSMLKGYNEEYDEDTALGNLTLGEIASLNEIRNNALSGSASSSGSASGRMAISPNGVIQDSDMNYAEISNPYLSYP